MRDFLNAVLAFIGSASLSDDEFSGLEIESASYNSATYDALLAILDARETVSNTRDRLRYYFLARNVSISETSAGKSNIYIGSVLCD
jgi:hypothetical protein